MNWIVISVFVVAAVMAALIFGGVPGALARNRGHANAQAITICGWLGVVLWPLWLVALVWAFTGRDSRQSQASIWL